MKSIGERLGPEAVQGLIIFAKTCVREKREEHLVSEIGELARLGCRIMEQGGCGLTLPSGHRLTRFLRNGNHK